MRSLIPVSFLIKFLHNFAMGRKTPFDERMEAVRLDNKNEYLTKERIGESGVCKKKKGKKEKN